VFRSVTLSLKELLIIAGAFISTKWQLKWN